VNAPTPPVFDAETGTRDARAVLTVAHHHKTTHETRGRTSWAGRAREARGERCRETDFRPFRTPPPAGARRSPRPGSVLRTFDVIRKDGKRRWKVPSPPLRAEGGERRMPPFSVENPRGFPFHPGPCGAHHGLEAIRGRRSRRPQSGRDAGRRPRHRPARQGGRGCYGDEWDRILL
jgi:hypothetical protein